MLPYDQYSLCIPESLPQCVRPDGFYHAASACCVPNDGLAMISPSSSTAFCNSCCNFERLSEMSSSGMGAYAGLHPSSLDDFSNTCHLTEVCVQKQHGTSSGADSKGTHVSGRNRQHMSISDTKSERSSREALKMPSQARPLRSLAPKPFITVHSSHARSLVLSSSIRYHADKTPPCTTCSRRDCQLKTHKAYVTHC
jgi:hypothetical protein